MNNVLAYFGGFLAVILAALFAAPAMIDWNGYRGVFEEEASKVLGRDVRVGGGVNLRLLPTPYVKFERVRLADVTGNTGEPFIRVESFTMRLAVPALLRGVLEATEIELTKPALTLALDGAGGGNWTTISLKPGVLPFVPRDVTLRSVKLIDAAISVYAPDARVVTRIEKINGELAADALRGPFRFKGVATWSGAEREIRFATTDMAADGGFRIKAVSRAPATGNAFTLEARVDDFTSAPKLTGNLAGVLVPPGVAAVTDAETPAGGKQAPNMELKATMAADAGGAALSEISLSLVDAAEPQVITGSASANWIDKPRLDVALASKWLDLDRLAGAGGDGAPFLKIKQLAMGVIGWVAGDGGASAKIDIEQVKIGGETAGAMKIDAERRDGVVRLKELRAGLPGGSRLGLFGDIKPADGGGLSFTGEGFVNGASLGRLKAWAEKSGASIDIGPAGAFSAEGKVRISDRRFELTEASAEFGGRTMTGELKIIDDGRHRAEITVESAELERSDLFPETTKALEAAISRAIGVTTDPTVADAPVSPVVRAGNMDVRLRVLAGQLKRGGEVYRDVDATVALEKGDIRVPSAKFTTAAGLAVMVEGRIDNKDGTPTGAIAFDAAGRTPASMRDLVHVFGIDGLLPADRAERFGSAKLAGLLRLGARTRTSADISIDGLLAGSQISVFGAFDAGLGAWRLQPSQIRVAMSAPEISDLAAALGAPRMQPGPSRAVRPVRLALTTSGAIETGAASRLDIAADGLHLGYNGSLAWVDGKSIDAAGQMTIDARDISDVMAIVGAAHATGLTGVALKGGFDVERQQGNVSLTTQSLAVGSSVLKGAVKLATGAGGETVIAGDVWADHVSVAGLLAPLVDASATEPPAAISAGAVAIEDAPRAPYWPSGRFNFAATTGLSGEVALKFSRLTVGDGLQMRSGGMTLAPATDRLILKDVSGEAAGGTLAGNVTLRKSSSGVAAEAKLALADVELSTLSASATGKAGFDISLAGQALSPAALIASLLGEGRLQLDAARIRGPSHAAIKAVAEGVLAGKIGKDTEMVSAALTSALADTVVDLGARSVDVKIVNGVASTAPITLDDDDGVTTSTASLDLGSLDLTSLWKVAPKPSPSVASADEPAGWKSAASKGLLPAASIVFNGRLDDLSAVTPMVESASLQRELAVRQLERNVEDLERLRRMDENRARQERDRRKAVEEQRARAASEARARRIGEPQPPVLPESFNAGPPAPPSSRSMPESTPQPQPQSQSGSQTSPNAATENTVDVGQPSAQPTDNVAAPPGEAVTVAPPPVGDPGLEAKQKVFRPRRPREAAPRRSADEDVLKPLGGFP